MLEIPVVAIRRYRTAQNIGGFGTARKLVEKILAVDYTNTNSLFELTRTYNIWQIKLWRIANCQPNLPKFSPTKVLCHMVTHLPVHIKL